MQKLKNIYQVDTVPIVNGVELVTQPHLIKIQTIKRKIVDQIEEVHPSTLLNTGQTVFKILGRVSPYVLAHSLIHQYVKFHRNDFVDFVTSILVKNEPKERRIITGAVHAEALKLFYELPQLFET